MTNAEKTSDLAEKARPSGRGRLEGDMPVTAAEVLDEMIADLKRRENTLVKLREKYPESAAWADAVGYRVDGIQIAINLMESRRKALPEEAKC